MTDTPQQLIGLLDNLKSLAELRDDTAQWDLGDQEAALVEVCEAFAAYVGNNEVTALVDRLVKWYA